jgi:gentisate 1,2-dioxygenase
VLSEKRQVHAVLSAHPSALSIIINYEWERTEEALRQLATSGVSPFDDVALEYINPHTGGPVLPTMACWIPLIAFGLYREQAYEANNGHQAISREFRP